MVNNDPQGCTSQSLETVNMLGYTGKGELRSQIEFRLLVSGP